LPAGLTRRSAVHGLGVAQRRRHSVDSPSEAFAARASNGNTPTLPAEGDGLVAFWLSAGALGLVMVGAEVTVVAPLTAHLKDNHSLWARYFFSLAMPVGTGIVAAVVVRNNHWTQWANRGTARLLAVIAQILFSLVLAIIAWRDWTVGHVFTRPTDGVAALSFVIGLLVAFSLVRGTQPVVLRQAGRLLRVFTQSGPIATVVGLALMVVSTIAAMSLAIYTTATQYAAPTVTTYHFQFVEEELTAIFAGRVPDVTFVPQYVNVIGYLTAPWFAIFGTSIGSFTAVMAMFSGFAFLAVGLLFKSLFKNWLLTAVLYVLYLSIAMLPGYRYSYGVVTVVNYPALMPLRYLGPFLLLAAIGFALRRQQLGWWFAIGTLSGLVLANNLDFGLAAALAALVTALVGGSDLADRSWRFPTMATLGVVVGFLAFWIALWCQAGSFPSIHQYEFFAVDLGTGGTYSAHMGTVFGVQLVLWCTYAACVSIPIFRWIRGRRDDMTRLRDGLMVFVGVFGFGSGLYYVNRALQPVVKGLIVTWAIAAILVASEIVLRIRAQLRTRGRVHWAIALPLALTVSLAGLGIGSFSDTRNLAGQIRLLTSTQKRVDFLNPHLIETIKSCTRQGEHVMLMIPNGYSIALQAGVSNWMPYNNPGTVSTSSQIRYLEHVVGQENVGEVYFQFSWPVPFVKDLGSKGWIQYEVVYAGEPTSGMVLIRHPGPAWRLPKNCPT
jgi:hypothetical protein